jgi:hypothetical protein
VAIGSADFDAVTADLVGGAVDGKQNVAQASASEPASIFRDVTLNLARAT